MPNPKGLTGEMPVTRPCTTMHLGGPRRRGLISESDGTHTSKCPYMDVCNQPRRMGIMDAIRGYSVDLRCTLHSTLSCTLEVAA